MDFASKVSAGLQFHVGLFNQSNFNVSSHGRKEIIGLVSEFSCETYPSDLGLQGKLPLTVCNRKIARSGAKLEVSEIHNCP